MTLLTAPEGSFTIEKFKRLPLEGRRWELLDSAVVKMEPHSFATSALTAWLTGAIAEHVQNGHLGRTLAAGCGFRCWPGRETVRVTDISFSRHSTIPADQDPHDFPRWAPDLIVEAFSPCERFVTLLGRIVMFLQAGTKLVWLVDPTERSLFALQSDRPIRTFGLESTLDGGEVLPGFILPVAEIFAEAQLH